MSKRTKLTKQCVEFGDFQTPSQLCREICNFLKSQGVRPQSVVEPNCGVGNFVLVCIETFDSTKRVLALDINGEHLQELGNKIVDPDRLQLEVRNMDFFKVDWANVFAGLPKPLLVIGNPPWVTNSQIGALNGTNLPMKCNLHGYNGLDALTGKSNFDISEWMLVRLCEHLQRYDGSLAMLCKTSVARKVLKYAWRNHLQLRDVSIHRIDAEHYFGVSVEACLLVCRTGQPHTAKQCPVYQGLSNKEKTSTVGIRDSELVADIEKYTKWSFLDGVERYKWRSGVKHDCAKVMELIPHSGKFMNGIGEFCDLEPDFMYPLFKSSDIAHNRVTEPKRWVLITQREIQEDTTLIEQQAPKTWDYLVRHSDCFDRRKSSVYMGRPPFSIFGIGEYTFSPWKVCISGLYKKIRFCVLGPHDGRPSMVDDTCYYVSCDTQDEAALIADLLNSKPAEEFLSSLIFWDSKRPITIDVLRRIDLLSLGGELGKSDALRRYLDNTLFDHISTSSLLCGSGQQ